MKSPDEIKQIKLHKIFKDFSFVIKQEESPMSGRTRPLLVHYYSKNHVDKTVFQKEASETAVAINLAQLQEVRVRFRDKEECLNWYKSQINNERAYAVMAGSLVRMLVGSDAPKLKYRKSENKLICTYIANGMDLITLYNEIGPDKMRQHMNDIIKVALIRCALGCAKREMRFENMFFANNKFFPIDTDDCFSDDYNIDTIPLTAHGMRSLYAAQGDQAWNFIFQNSKNEEIKKTMLKTYQDIATILTPDIIKTVVDYIAVQFQLSQSARDHALYFMINSRNACIRQVEKHQQSQVELDSPVSIAPWLKNLVETNQFPSYKIEESELLAALFKAVSACKLGVCRSIVSIMVWEFGEESLQGLNENKQSLLDVALDTGDSRIIDLLSLYGLKNATRSTSIFSSCCPGLPAATRNRSTHSL